MSGAGNDALIVGSGVVPFAKRVDDSHDLLAARAVRLLFAAGDVKPEHVQEVYCAAQSAGSLIAQRALRYCGLSGMPMFNLENACASGAAAAHLAWRAIRAGDIDCALVMGVEKLSSFGTGPLPINDTEWESRAGVTMPSVYAMRAQRYMHDHGATKQDLAEISVKSRKFASENPVAQMRGTVTVEEVLGSRPVADPLTLFQCSPKSDGAAAIMLCSRDFASRNGLDGPQLRHSTLVSGVFSMAERDITRPDISSRAVSAAYEATSIGPEDLDVVELHDAFSIAELLYYEEFGLCPDGGAVEHLRKGRSSSLSAGDPAVVNPSGGLLGRGHPVGATGVAQLAECAGQLRGTQGPRQREGARTALAHVTGGGASGFDNGVCTVSILTAD